MKISLFLTAAFCLLALAACGNTAADGFESGESYGVLSSENESGGFLYDLLENKTVRITGYTGDDSAVIIPDKLDGFSVTGIADGAFEDNSKIIYVKIGDNVTYIGSYAFSNCTGLLRADLGKRVKYINDGAFTFCRNMCIINLPGSVTYIGDSAFANCFVLISVSLPKNLAYLGREAFSSCRLLTSVSIPKKLKSVGEGAFMSCTSLTSVELGGLTAVSDNMFRDCAYLSEISLSKKIKAVGENAFRGCTLLKRVKLPSALSSIGSGAFRDTYWYDTAIDELYLNGEAPAGTDTGCIKKKYISSGYAVIGNGLLIKYCGSEESVRIPSGIKLISDAFTENLTLRTASLPKSVQVIGADAFRGCSRLRELNIPKNVNFIGVGAFADCRSLTSATYSGSEKDFAKITLLDGSDKLLRALVYAKK